MKNKERNEPDEIWTVEETARFLKLSKVSVYKAVKEKKLPAVLFGNRLRFSRRAVEDFMYKGGKKK